MYDKIQKNTYYYSKGILISYKWSFRRRVFSTNIIIMFVY